jgi:hypothetical protein
MVVGIAGGYPKFISESIQVISLPGRDGDQSTPPDMPIRLGQTMRPSAAYADDDAFYHFITPFSYDQGWTTTLPHSPEACVSHAC